ncbi:endonuclease domain-containing 1 protein-like [Chanodichthys erythropterus]|uniref:endonuclease domain-containing 1 protein-like n=1 Tax=Chanodichthys erythropterus TaxID=933992 RepID=UPI00351E4F1C
MHLFFVSVLLVFGFPFIMTDVVDSFETCKGFFFKEKCPVFPGILENSVSKNQNQYRIICQKYKNTYRYGTLYDIKNKIPLFSAYKYTGHTGKRPNVPWMMEPQLDDLNAGMSAFPNQANNGDYVNKEHVNRGHLFPCCHAADQDTAESTFTLTNAVPQYTTFNGGSWSVMEQKVKSTMDSKCRDEKNENNILAYVLTGAVSNTRTPPHLLKNKVNIPSDMWTVFCCYNKESKKWVSQAHWAENKDESKGDGKTIPPKTLGDLQTFLKSKYNKENKLFPDGCSDYLDADVSPPPVTDCCDEPDIEKQSWWSTVRNLPATFWAWLRGY